MAKTRGRKPSATAKTSYHRGPLPSQTEGDTVQAIVRTGLSIVPAGSAVAELIDLVIQPRLDRIRDDWFNGVATDLQTLMDRPDAPTIEELSKNELFVTVVLSATQAALRTHQVEKLEALRAAVMNSALTMAPNEHEQLMFVRFVDELTALHLQILSYMRDPPGWFTRHNIPKPDLYQAARSAVLEAAFPPLKGRADVYIQLFNELAARGLAGGISISGAVSQQSLYDKLTSPLGDRFLDFITAPAESE